MHYIQQLSAILPNILEWNSPPLFSKFGKDTLEVQSLRFLGESGGGGGGQRKNLFFSLTATILMLFKHNFTRCRTRKHFKWHLDKIEISCTLIFWLVFFLSKIFQVLLKKFACKHFCHFFLLSKHLSKLKVTLAISTSIYNNHSVSVFFLVKCTKM